MVVERLRPNSEFIGIVAEISPMRLGHMFRLDDGFALRLVQADMSRDLCLLVKHLHNMLGKPHVNLLSDQIKGNGVFVEAVAHQIIIADLWMKPNGRLVCIDRKGLKKLLFLLLKRCQTTAGTLLERTAVQLLQLFGNSLLCFANGKELAVAKRGCDPCRYKADRAFCRGAGTTATL